MLYTLSLAYLEHVSARVVVCINNNKSEFKEPSSNQTPLKTLYNDGKKKEKKSEKKKNVCKNDLKTPYTHTHTHTHTHARQH